MNLIKVVSRGQSTVVDAYLSTVIGLHLEGVRKATGRIPIEFMLSSGSLAPPGAFQGKDALLSGPAGGVIAVTRVAEQTGAHSVIGFDMGGTSTDVCRYEGEPEKVYESMVGGIELQNEMLKIETVASGGGSILWFDGQKMRVGPESAGAFPGPACYGFGGPLTVTDANLLTGRIVTDFFPKSFGPNRDAPLNQEIVRTSFEKLAKTIHQATGRKISPLETALGFLRIANEKMAMAIKRISVSRGFDVRNDTLVCFGGAGGQHACQVASILDIDRIVFHPLSSVMSAYGIGLARPSHRSARTLLEPYTPELHRHLGPLFHRMIEEIRPEGLPPDRIILRQRMDLRLSGTDHFFTLDYDDYEKTLSGFRKRYRSLFGFDPEGKTIEVVNLRVELEGKAEFFPSGVEHLFAEGNDLHAIGSRTLEEPSGSMKAPVYRREELPPGASLPGPCYVTDTSTTFVIEPGFEAEVKENGLLLARRSSPGGLPRNTSAQRADPVLLEVFHHLFMGVAVEMGETLRNTAHSVNIRERLDFSCAVFDHRGDLVANAPHIPVHLGSMADTVKAVIQERKDEMRAGDIYLTNNPHKGGSHLPDLTLVNPVFSPEGKLLFFTSARGHHADIGGITPGSMPPRAETITDEGVLLDNLLLVRDGIFREEKLRRILTGSPHPVRNIQERISDLTAQIAACRKGTEELWRVIEKYGWETVERYMEWIQDNACFSVQKALSRFLHQGDPYRAAFQDRLDDGTPLCVRIEIRGGANPPESIQAVIDFSGTGPYHEEDNLNTPISVTRSAVLYVLRALTGEEIPLNSGCLRPIEIRVPADSILSPPPHAPVATGNVETSQRIVDLLLGALETSAASQGTMNNLLFEVEGESPYYETIGGGSGGMEGCRGASGVQVHMTNTRITDPEILEVRHPGIRLMAFTLRKGSGGVGKFPGGDGILRKIRFLKPSTVSILSERRVFPPYGMAGGGPGRRGVNQLLKQDGSLFDLPHRVVVRLEAGDSVILRTPGGGGYGTTWNP